MNWAMWLGNWLIAFVMMGAEWGIYQLSKRYYKDEVKE